MPDILGSHVLFLEAVGAAFLAAEILFYFYAYHQTRRKIAQWNSIKAQADMLTQLIGKQMTDLVNAQHYAEQGPETMLRSQKVAANAVLFGAQLALQVPSVYSVEYIKENLFSSFNPQTMNAAFISISHYKDNPRAAKNALLTVLYGREPGAMNGQRDLFLRIYSTANDLMAVRIFDSKIFGKDGIHSDWGAIMHAFSELIDLEPAALTQPLK
jgi:hypothetical protein